MSIGGYSRVLYSSGNSAPELEYLLFDASETRHGHPIKSAAYCYRVSKSFETALR